MLVVPGSDPNVVISDPGTVTGTTGAEGEPFTMPPLAEPTAEPTNVGANV